MLDPATEAAHIRAMFVRPDWTRRGLGRAIRPPGTTPRGHTVSPGSTSGPPPRAWRFYRAFGFREVAPFVLTMPDGVTLDAVVMERPIDRV